MKNKGTIITGILFITISIIVFIRYYINRDTVQTREAQIDFFSDHLTEQKNYIINSFKTTSTYAFRHIESNAGLKNNIGKLVGDINENSYLIDTIKRQISTTYQYLSEAGFSDLNLIFFDSTNTYYLQTGTEEGCQTLKQAFYEIDIKKNLEIPAHGFSICEKLIGYKFIYPLIFDPIKNKYTVFVEMGFGFEKLPGLITHNTGNLGMGYILSFNENEKASEIIHLNGFHEYNRGNIWTNDKFSIPIELEEDKKLKNEFIEKISTHNGNKDETDFSIYLSTHKNTKVMTLSRLNLLGFKGCVFLVSINHDMVLDKTRDWNNQIFIINLIIILLIMIGISYLVLNRIQLQKQKEIIQSSEQKLIELNEAKDKFFSILAHDLKNPFNGILGMSEYLNVFYDTINDDKKHEIINDINISSKNAFNLLQNLLEWTRTQSGTIKNTPSIIDTGNIIDISLETVVNLAKNKQIKIVKKFQTNKKGWADENLVSTVLRNLFTNAVKFSPRNSTIETIVKDYQEELVFCVKDEGIGLKSNEIDQLFRIDVNFHKRGTEQETGTGLGLKICKEFATYCNGRIWVISEPNKGSRFYFTIPLFKKP